METEIDPQLVMPQAPEQIIGGTAAQFIAALDNEKLWANIPLLNYTPLHLLKSGSVVRFRGMIQDMQDPEIYLERYEVKKPDGSTRMQEGKYRDFLVLGTGEEADFQSKETSQGERRTLFVVSIPGINNWTQEYEKRCNHNNLPAIRTQSKDSAETVGKRAALDSDANCSEPMDVDVEGNSPRPVVLPANEYSKRRCMQNVAVDNDSTLINNMHGPTYLLNSPIPERPGKACMIKVYSDFDTYTLHSIIDVVGFLSIDSALEASNMFDNVEFSSELHAQNPPPTLIPRLHAFKVNLLKHANPLLDQRLDPLTNEEELNMLAVQKDFRILLKLCLFEDELAVDYLLAHLISTVYCRDDFQTIGKFALNVCNLPKETVAEYTKNLYGILEQLLPASHYLPMNLETMNTSAFVPIKDYETNKLVSGLLQLAPHTHLILDETQMQEGKLEANGIRGIQNLANLIKNQQIRGNFKYFEIDYDVDVPVLILSEGRSMLPNDFVVPLEVDNKSIELITEAFKAAQCFLNSTRLDRFRRYLTKAKTTTFAMLPNDRVMIQSDFVEMRKSNILAGGDDLHSLLVLSRLLAIGCGKDTFDKKYWTLAKEMEAKRKQRLLQLPRSNRMKINGNLST